MPRQSPTTALPASIDHTRHLPYKGTRWTLLGALVALTACASAPPPPFTADGAATRAALAAYESCAWSALAGIQGTTRTDPALQVASVAEGTCGAQRVALQAALDADNQRPHGRTYAESFVKGRRSNLINRMAERLLQGR